MDSTLYPMLFEPVYKDIMWGGTKMAGLGRDLPELENPIAESWEITDRDNGQSVIENGEYAGKTLRDLIEMSPTSVVGPKHKADQPFPLLIKIIDAAQRLSLQVHPNEESCKILEGAEPKTEMWYVLDSDANADIFAGLKASATKQNFLEKMADPAVEDLLQSFPSRKGDAYFIPAGRIHAIGAGNLIYEVQQNSFTTYRVSDWGRVGKDGTPRELHVDEALQSIHFTDRMQPRIAGDCSAITRNKRNHLITNCPFFTVEELRLTGTFCDDTKQQSFHTLFSTGADFEIAYDGGTVKVPGCRSVLIPASLGAYKLNVTEPTLILKSML